VGIAPEALWSYDPSNDNNPLTKEKFQLPPSSAAEQAAPGYRVAQIKSLRTLRQIRTELAKRNPVVIGMEVFEAFNEPPGGLLTLPQPGEETQGGHAVLVVGYDDARGLLIVRNSWSTQWGDQGYFYMPYEYVRRGLASDAWVASRL
jgi:C1A family cysteine protease